MIDRSPQFELEVPPASVEPHEPPFAHDHRAALRSFIKQHASAIGACLPSDPMTVVIRFTVGKDGYVQRSTADGEQRRFEDCIADTLAGIFVPRPPGDGTLIISFPWR